MKACHLIGRYGGLPLQKLPFRLEKCTRQKPVLATSLQRFASSHSQSQLQNSGRPISQNSTLDTEDSSVSAVNISTLLQHSSQLFTPDSILSSPVWLARTQKVAERISQPNPALITTQSDNSKVRIGIIGNQQSGTQSLVEVLLDDPLAQNTSQIEQEKSSIGNEDIQFNESKRNANVLRRLSYAQSGAQVERLSSALWLRDRNVEIVELLNPIDTQANRSMLYECNVLVFVIDEVTLAAHERFGRDLKVDDVLKLLRYFAQKPATKVVINHSGQHISDAQILERGLRTAISEEGFTSLCKNASEDATIVHASLPLAQRANESLRQALARVAPGSPDPAEWNHFTTLFSSSGFAEVRYLIEEQAQARSEVIEYSTASFALRRALEQAQFSVHQYSEQVQQARGAANVIRKETDAALESMMKRIFDSNKESRGLSVGRTIAMHQRAGDRSKDVDAASKDAWNEVEKTLSSRLPWWKVVWKVDDVRAEMEAAIERGYARDLEQRLMVQSGRLISVAERLQKRIRSLFFELDQSGKKIKSTREDDDAEFVLQERQYQTPFASPLLLNELRKYPIEAIERRLQEEDLLTKPIIIRRSQLLANGGPIDKLCTKAQSSTIKTVGLTGTTGMITLASGLAGSSTLGIGMPSTFQLIAMEPLTAFATFAFASTIGAVFMQSRWSRAKRRFWREWQSVSDGLDDDLRSNVERVFDQVVAGQSRAAAEGLDRIARQNQNQLKQVQSKVQRLIEQSSNLNLTENK